MAKRKIASILIQNEWSCIKSENTTFPLWAPQEHLDYMVAGGYTDIIVSSNSASTLKAISTVSGVNMIAALGWSGVYSIRDLFESGYSKVFLGGRNRSLPTPDEKKVFDEMVHVYGASSFGYTLHFEKVCHQINMEFLANFNEILLIQNVLQLHVDEKESAKWASYFNEYEGLRNIEVNLCAPFLNYRILAKLFNKPMNYVNYCEHAIAKLR